MSIMSKVLQTGCTGGKTTVFRLGMRQPMFRAPRRKTALIPPSQYDIPIPKRLQLPYVLKVYWETIPLFLSTATAIAIVFSAIFWACVNKVDVVWTTHSCNNISRTMNLRHPTVHKMMIINQRYEPWPEMQDVLDMMREAEINLMNQATICSVAQ